MKENILKQTSAPEVFKLETDPHMTIALILDVEPPVYTLECRNFRSLEVVPLWRSS